MVGDHRAVTQRMNINSAMISSTPTIVQIKLEPRMCSSFSHGTVADCAPTYPRVGQYMRVLRRAMSGAIRSGS
ncbi:hypothetical protein BJY20_000741 [Janibacter cremeus]|uniref:Uncharacterized protein n=1 Tax=Janibacter cremeus TaxID=1285192 RepID=A0A852VN35_9MICO|nr:hypothetical protein [Janibacter cremeus]